MIIIEIQTGQSYLYIVYSLKVLTHEKIPKTSDRCSTQLACKHEHRPCIRRLTAQVVRMVLVNSTSITPPPPSFQCEWIGERP